MVWFINLYLAYLVSGLIQFKRWSYHKTSFRLRLNNEAQLEFRIQISRGNVHGSEPKPGTKGSTDFWMANILRINYLPPSPLHPPQAHTRQHLQETPQIVWSYLDTSTNISFGLFLGSDMAFRDLGCVCVNISIRIRATCVRVFGGSEGGVVI